jgi:hypothetical protein
VIVSAADNALGDLGLNCTPAHPVLQTFRHVPPLCRRVDMVEVKDDGISFATVDARMRS